jgi:hypothetical protein
MTKEEYKQQEHLKRLADRKYVDAGEKMCLDIGEAMERGCDFSEVEDIIKKSVESVQGETQ